MERHCRERKKQSRIKSKPEKPSAIPSVFTEAGDKFQNSLVLKLEQDPYFRTGYVYQSAGNLGAAALCYTRSIERGPSPEAYTYLAYVQSLMGQLDAAIANCRRAVELNPEYGNAWSDLGVYLMEKQVYDEALDCLKRALSAKGTTSRGIAYFNLARAYTAKGMLGAALEAIEQCLKHEPQADQAKLIRDELIRNLH